MKNIVIKQKLCAKYNLDISELKTRVFSSSEHDEPVTLDEDLDSSIDCSSYTNNIDIDKVDIDKFCIECDIEEIFNMKVNDVLMHESGQLYPTISDYTRIK